MKIIPESLLHAQSMPPLHCQRSEQVSTSSPLSEVYLFWLHGSHDAQPREDHGLGKVNNLNTAAVIDHWGSHLQ